MGKRNVRIRQDQLQERFAETLNKEVHVVLLDGTTYFGKVLAAELDEVVVQDINARWTHQKRHTHTLKCGDISEIIFDVVADY